jgi:site-specific DNA-methyltransferase (adenine-specific)
MSSHWFTRVQWTLPTKENYQKLQVRANALDSNCLQRDYEDLRREYEDLRREYEDLRRPFAVTARDQWSDVWDFDPVRAYAGKHPCEKPLPLLCHILKASTKAGAVVFDPFAGSASLGEACYELGRDFIGVEKCPNNYAKAQQRIANVQAQSRLFA